MNNNNNNNNTNNDNNNNNNVDPLYIIIDIQFSLIHSCSKSITLQIAM